VAKTVVVSYSELDAFRQCPLKHKLSYLDRWRSEDTSPALSRGTAWHAMLEAHYTQIKAAQAEGHPDHDWRTNNDALTALGYKCGAAAGKALYDANMNDDQVDLLTWMYHGHVERYGLDPGWQILAVEYRAELPLYTTADRKSRFRLKAKIDLIVRDLTLAGQPVMIVDQKTCKDLPAGKHLDLDDQFGLYEWLLRRQGKQVLGTVHAAARTQRNKAPMTLDDRFRRTRMHRNDHELKTIADDAWLVARSAYSASNLAQPSSSPDPDRCNWKCSFRDAHVYARKGVMPIESMLRSTGFVQNYERH
jgi:RecB family exonuclease